MKAKKRVEKEKSKVKKIIEAQRASTTCDNTQSCIINLFFGSIFPFCTSLRVEDLHKQGDTLEQENHRDSCSFSQV